MTAFWPFFARYIVVELVLSISVMMALTVAIEIAVTSQIPALDELMQLGLLAFFMVSVGLIVRSILLGYVGSWFLLKHVFSEPSYVVYFLNGIYQVAHFLFSYACVVLLGASSELFTEMYQVGYSLIIGNVLASMVIVYLSVIKVREPKAENE